MSDPRQNSYGPNVIPFPEPPAKTIPVESAGPFTFTLWAHTDRIGGTYCNTIYREEKILIDPDAKLEDDCLIVGQFKNGTPHMLCWWRTGRDALGRFVPAGDPREAFSTGYFKYTADDVQSGSFRVLGRVVGPPRYCERSG